MEKKCPIRSKYLPFSVFEYAILSYNHDKREMVIVSAYSFPRKGLKSVLEVVWESGSEWYRNLVGNSLGIGLGMVWEFDWDWDYKCHAPLERSKAHERNCISRDVDVITQPFVPWWHASRHSPRTVVDSVPPAPPPPSVEHQCLTSVRKLDQQT